MPEDSQYAIDTRDLTKVFGSFTAVDRVSFHVERGEIFAMLGPNGAGKSTTIRMLCGLLASTSGRAMVGGSNPTTEPEKVRQKIGYMSQKFSLYKDLTVTENLSFFGGVYGLDAERIKARAREVLAETGLDDVADRITGTLSGAVQQRLALANAIIHEPDILFLDEPTSGVDPISRRHFWDLIRTLTDRGVTALVTTHFMDEAEFCGRIGFINRGSLIASGTPSELKRQAVKEDLFEADVQSSGHVREELQAVDHVVAASYFGSRMHLFVQEGRYTPETLLAALKQKGLNAGGVRSIPVTLEDTFIRLAGQTEGGGEK